MQKTILLLLLALLASCSAPDFKVEKFSNMQVPRQEISGAVLNEKFYIIGGIYADRKPSDAVEIYHPKNDSWALSQKLPAKMHHIGIATYSNKIYAIGGFATESEKFIPVDSVFVFDGERWTEKSKMPTARGGLGIAVLEGKLYAIGGADDKKSLSIVEVYDPGADKWEEHSYMNFARDHLAVASAHGKIYAIGGRESTKWPFSNKGEVEVFENGKWKILDAKIKPRSGMAFAVYDGRIYLYGGESALTVFDDFEIIENGKITQAKAQLTPRHGMTALAYGNRVYFIGGADSAGYGVSAVNEAVVIE